MKVGLLVLNGFLERVLKAADCILNLASGLLRLAFGFELDVAGHFAHDFLDLTFGLLDGALNSILVHVVLYLWPVSANVTTTIERLRSFRKFHPLSRRTIITITNIVPRPPLALLMEGRPRAMRAHQGAAQG